MLYHIHLHLTCYCIFSFLQTLRREKVLRIFKLNTGQDDHAVMFWDDYINQVRSLHNGDSFHDLSLFFSDPIGQ